MIQCNVTKSSITLYCCFFKKLISKTCSARMGARVKTPLGMFAHHSQVWVQIPGPQLIPVSHQCAPWKATSKSSPSVSVIHTRDMNHISSSQLWSEFTRYGQLRSKPVDGREFALLDLYQPNPYFLMLLLPIISATLWNCLSKFKPIVTNSKKLPHFSATFQQTIPKTSR